MFAGRLKGGIIAVYAVVVRQDALNGFDTGIADNDAAVFFNTALVAVFVGKAGFQHGLFFGRNFVEFFAVSLLRGQIQPCDQLAVQPVGCPVGSLVCAVSQYGTDFHTAGGLPGGLTCQNIVFGHQLSA